ERTEEKKKIFELAGGAAKKKNSETGREKKKQVVTYLPLVEQKRRETWRAYNGREGDSSLCVTDETSTVTTPVSDRSPSLKKKHSQQPMMIQLARNELSPYQQQTIRKGSDAQSWSETERPKISCLTSTSNVTDRADDWFNEDSPSETHSYEVEGSVVQEATPEEVR
ncbi:unnamed protein product, partial [Gongylonema pulchrum]|uniref:Breast cancer susceptibility 1 n=1 Tax=Gongylonema pulchrum TaxID=637853 RepID=A0A183D448_9BILA